MKYKAIIFDMDGTIIHTEGAWEIATQKLLENYGIVLSPHQKRTVNHQTRGLALPASCLFIKHHFKLDCDHNDLAQELMHLGNTHYQDGLKFIRGFRTFHKKLNKLNLKSGIATNAADSTVTLVNQQLNLEKFFGKHIYAISHVNNIHKPHPAIYLHVADQLGVDPSECIAIEDSAHGLQAAKDAGMFCIGINTSRDPKQLKNAHLIIDAYHEIPLEDLIKK